MNKKNFATILIVLAIVLCAAVVLIVLVTEEQRDTELTEEMREELGAALLVERNVNLYLAGKNVFGRMRGIWESNAMQRVYGLPTVKQALAMAKMNPEYQEFMRTVTRHPLFVEGEPVLKDGLSDEVFVCADDHLAPFLNAVRTVNSTQQFASLMDEFSDSEPDVLQEKRQEALFEALKREKENLQFPNFLIGMKVTQVEDAEQFIRKALDSLPAEMRERGEWETVDEHEFYVMTLTGDMLPEEMKREIANEIDNPKHAEVIDDFLRDQNLNVAVGLKNDYLLFSLGRSLAAVESFAVAEQNSLAASNALEPLRLSFHPSLLGVSYASEQLMAGVSGAGQMDEVGESVKRAVRAVPADKRPEGIEERVERDMAELQKDLRKYMVEPSPFLQFSFANQGIETFKIKPAWRVDSEPLSILRFRGQNPLFFRASSGVKTADVYSLLEKWLAKGYGYVNDWAVPQMLAEDQEQFRKIEAVFLPFLKDCSRINRTQLIPAVDGGQSLSVADTQGTLKNTEFQANSSNALPIPRVGFVIQLNDAELFQRAMAGYYDAAQEVLGRMRESELMGDATAGLSLPSVPVTEDGLYYCALPWDLGEDVFPCAGFADDVLFLSTSKAMNVELRSPVSPPENEVVDLAQPAAAVAVADFEALWQYLLELNDAIVAEAAMRDDVPGMYRQAIGLGRFHLDTLYKSLSAFRNYAKVATVDDQGRVAVHSWLNVQDVE